MIDSLPSYVQEVKDESWRGVITDPSYVFRKEFGFNNLDVRDELSRERSNGIYLRTNARQTRILRPAEYALIRAIAPGRIQMLMDGLLVSGMRYTEFQAFMKNPSWFDGDFIKIPFDAVRKNFVESVDRFVRLSPWGKQIIRQCLSLKINAPSRQSLDESIKQYAYKCRFNKLGISQKMFRKTWESWLTVTYPNINPAFILTSQGHSDYISLRYYLSLPFTEKDKADMKLYTDGWIT